MGSLQGPLSRQPLVNGTALLPCAHAATTAGVEARVTGCPAVHPQRCVPLSSIARAIMAPTATSASVMVPSLWHGRGPQPVAHVVLSKCQSILQPAPWSSSDRAAAARGLRRPQPVV